MGSRLGLANSGSEEKRTLRRRNTIFESSEVKQQGNRVQRWIQASRNGHRGLQDLQHAAAQWGLHLDATADADSILLVLVVILVQRAYRLRLALFSLFGNMLFARSPLNGQPLPADYGSIHFPHDVENSMYLVCADTTSPTLLANFLMHGPWKLPRPNLIITITGALTRRPCIPPSDLVSHNQSIAPGGARDFELKPARLARLFAQGIVEAALTANAIVTAAVRNALGPALHAPCGPAYRPIAKCAPFEAAPLHLLPPPALLVPCPSCSVRARTLVSPSLWRARSTSQQPLFRCSGWRRSVRSPGGGSCSQTTPAPRLVHGPCSINCSRPNASLAPPPRPRNETTAKFQHVQISRAACRSRSATGKLH